MVTAEELAELIDDEEEEDYDAELKSDEPTMAIPAE